MKLWPVVLYGLIFLTCTIACARSKRVNDLAARIVPLLNLFSILAAIGVFIQLYYSVYQYNVAQLDTEQQASERMLSRLDTLETELLGNLSTCKSILRSPDVLTTGKTSVQDVFQFVMLEAMLASGEVTNKTLRFTLYEAYHELIFAGTIMDQNMAYQYNVLLHKVEEEQAQHAYDRQSAVMAILKTNVQVAQDDIEKALAMLPAFRKSLRETR